MQGQKSLVSEQPETPVFPQLPQHLSEVPVNPIGALMPVVALAIFLDWWNRRK